MTEVKLREIAYKLKNVIRLLVAARSSIDETRREFVKEFVNEVNTYRGDRQLWDKYGIEEMLLKLHPVMEGKGILQTISRIEGESGNQSSVVSLPHMNSSGGNLFQSSLSQEKLPESSKEMSDISEDGKGSYESVIQFTKSNEKRLLEAIKINKNLSLEFKEKDALYVVGCSEPQDNLAVVLCAVMKFADQQVVSLSKESKDMVCFMNSQRFPIAVAKIHGEGEELDSNFLHSVPQINSKLNLGIVFVNNKFLIFQLTPEGLSEINSCTQTGPHKHKWEQKSSKYLRFFQDKDVLKCFIEAGSFQTKYIRRSCEKNNVIKVEDCIQLSEKIEAKNYSYKFVQKYYSTIKWLKSVYLVLLPNEQNVLDRCHRFDRLEDIVAKYAQQRVVICTKIKDQIPADFSKVLLRMKEAVACAVCVKISGTIFLLYKLSPQANQAKIQDVSWEGVETGKHNGTFQKILTYSKSQAKQNESKAFTSITQI